MRSIAHISDIHFGSHDPAQEAALLASLAHMQPDLVVVSGDLTQRARDGEFVQARRFLESIAAPKLVVPGNHDMPLFDLYERLFQPFAKFNAHVAPVSIPDCFFNSGGIAVLGLNTARKLTGKNGRVSHAQMDLIRGRLGSLPEGTMKIVVTHHPLASTISEKVTLAGRAPLALRTLKEADVHLLLSGHFHRSVSGEAHVEPGEDPSLLIAHAGTAISRRTRGEANSYNMIRAGNSDLSVSVMEAGAQGFEERAIVHYRLHNGTWRRLPVSTPPGF